MSLGPPPPLDRFDADIARGAPEPLSSFNRAGVLTAADLHVSETLMTLAQLELAPDERSMVGLAVALAVRAPRLGHVFVDLVDIATTIPTESTAVDLETLPWPDPTRWLAALGAQSRLVASDDHDEDSSPRPLRLLGSRLYLDRYWRQERGLSEVLLELDRHPLLARPLPDLASQVAALFPDPRDAAQRRAAASAALRGLTVVAGGPGTGKTTTVARTVALLVQLSLREQSPAPLIALCAPTGKAAARLAQAIAAETRELGLASAVRDGLASVRASTIHRLLGARGEGRFRHHAANPLPHDIVIVDETSMVSLSLIVHLLTAVRRDARVVLVGDPDQLSAIEAGAVLRDIVGPAAHRPTFGPGMRAILTQVTGTDPGVAATAEGFGSGVVVLDRNHRFGAPIGTLAEAIRAGDGDATVRALGDGTTVRWLAEDPGELLGRPDRTSALSHLARSHFGALLTAARDADAPAALAALARLRVLCAHRLGRYGVRAWTDQIETWLGDAHGLALEGNYPGRPLLVTENDHELRLYNGDSGVIVNAAEGPTANFEQEGGRLSIAPARLGSVETAYASTIHKSQGSQFGAVAIILPDPESRLLSRELLYTAVTRARKEVLIVGTEVALRAAVDRPVQRATGLGERLWSTG